MVAVWDEATYQKTVKLFFFIPVYKYKKTNSKKVWKICGVPVLKIRRKNGGEVLKYYFCGLRFLTAKIKMR